MLSDFARHGRIHIDGEELPTFSSTTNNNYAQLGAKPKIANNFRFCEMALWAGLVQRLQNPICRVFSAVKNVPTSVIKATKLDVVSDNLGVMKGARMLNANPLVNSGKRKSALGFL